MFVEICRGVLELAKENVPFLDHNGVVTCNDVVIHFLVESAAVFPPYISVRHCANRPIFELDSVAYTASRCVKLPSVETEDWQRLTS